MSGRRKPTRRDLLVVIGRLQGLIGSARADYCNDRVPNRADLVMDKLGKAHDLCVEARGYDAPIETRLGPWDQEGSGER